MPAATQETYETERGVILPVFAKELVEKRGREISKASIVRVIREIACLNNVMVDYRGEPVDHTEFFNLSGPRREHREKIIDPDPLLIDSDGTKPAVMLKARWRRRASADIKVEAAEAERSSRNNLRPDPVVKGRENYDIYLLDHNQPRATRRLPTWLKAEYRDTISYNNWPGVDDHISMSGSLPTTEVHDMAQSISWTTDPEFVRSMADDNRNVWIVTGLIGVLSAEGEWFGKSPRPTSN